MSSNRLLYDDCNVKIQVQDSTSQLGYYLYAGKYENGCSSCKGEFKNDLDFGTRADVESDLRNNAVRLQSRCPGKKYQYSKESSSNNITPHLLCDRIIVPHNQKMPQNPGFDISQIIGSCNN